MGVGKYLRKWRAMNRRIVVLVGGMSRERDVFLETGNAVSIALDQLGYDARTLDVGSDLVEKLTRLKGNGEVGVVLNALHGRYGEDGCVQGLCELLKIPYTHSGVLSSALAMNKVVSKQLFRKAGIPVPEGDVRSVRDVFTEEVRVPPFVVKPIDEGSSLGVLIVKNKSQTILDQRFWKGHKEVMVEEYIPGRELTVAVLDERSLEVLEIKPKQGFYDFESKYTQGRTEYLVPAPLPIGVRKEVLHYAQLAHVTLGCSGVTRADFRYDESRRNEGIKLLEINTQPGLTPTSLVPQIAAYAGLTFNALVDWMVRNARCNV